MKHVLLSPLFFRVITPPFCILTEPRNDGAPDNGTNTARPKAENRKLTAEPMSFIGTSAALTETTATVAAPKQLWPRMPG